MSEKTPIGSPSRKSWKDQTISIPIGTVLVLLGSGLGTLGVSGVNYAAGAEEVVTKADLVELQGEMRRLHATLEDIADTIDELHPRGTK
jgi:hypothetical protein